MYRIFNRKNKIYRSYDDYFNKKDLKDVEAPQLINLTIEDFNAKGEVANSRAPCVVTTIDPEYIKDASLQRRTNKFRMKTDILTLRDITRKKFMIYATQERYLEKQREAEYQERIYDRIREYQKFAVDALQKSESRAFSEMKHIQEDFENLQKNKISEELKNEIAEHQRIMMEVQEIYGRFLFLLKLIGYFDEVILPEDINDIGETERCKLPQPAEIVDLQINERNPIGKNEVFSINKYMTQIIRPYLAKRNHLNADIWIKDKTFVRTTKTQNFLQDPKFLKRRITFLEQRSQDVLDNFKRCQKKDGIQIKLNAILPVILGNVETTFLQNSGNIGKQIVENSKRLGTVKKSLYKNSLSLDPNAVCKNNHNSTLEKVEKLQWHLMGLLQDLEKIPPADCSRIENLVRRRIRDQKEMSRRVLIKQNRLQNWMQHFKKHALLQY